MSTLYSAYVWKLRNNTEKMTNDCWRCMNVCGFVWLKVYTNPRILGWDNPIFTSGNTYIFGLELKMEFNKRLKNYKQ